MIQRINLDNYPLYFEFACHSLKNKKLQMAQKQFTQCIQVNPSSFSSFLNLAYIYYLKKQFGKSQTMCNVAINMRPYNSEGYYSRCLNKLMQGSQLYCEANNDINAALSCAYFDSFKHSGSLQYLQKAIQFSQNNVQALRLMIILNSNNDNQYYQRLLNQYQDRYDVEGAFQIQNKHTIGNLGIFRLNGKGRWNSYAFIEQINEKIINYLNLITNQYPHLQKYSSSSTNKVNMSITSNIFSLSIERAPNCQSQEVDQDRFTFQKIQIHRLSDSIVPLRERLYSNTLNIPSQYSIRNSCTQKCKSSMKSSCSSFDNLSANSNFSQRSAHKGCKKCAKQSQTYPHIPKYSIKMLLKTIQIYRNQNIIRPKPYLIIYDGQHEHVTNIDYQGGFFPKWNQTFYLHKQSHLPYKMQLWHKGCRQNQDYLIGTAAFHSSERRIKCYFVKEGARKTGYAFIELTK